MSGVLKAQSPMEKRANRLFEQFAYPQAIELYEALIKKNPENKQVIRNLADAYRLSNNSDKAEFWLKKIVESGIAKNEDYLFLAQALASNGKKDQAIVAYETYDKQMAADKRGERGAKTLTSYSDLFAESGSYRVEQSGFSSTESDFSPSYYDNGLLFVSDGHIGSFAKTKYPWSNRRFLDIFYVPFTVGDSIVGNPERLSRKINSKYHEGPASFSKSLNKLAFTRNNFLNGKVQRSSDHINKISIYFASPSGKKWKDVQAFTYSNKEYSTGHPTFSNGGNTMYFISDMPGGFGGTDIYKTEYVNNAWTAPENLGSSVNSEGNELFPSVQGDSVLYFASNGWGGLGGLDIFKFQFNSSKMPENMGSPINSIADDFGIIFDSSGRSGYITSNRMGGKGFDDVYRFNFSPRPISLMVVDQDEVKAIPYAEVELFQGNNPVTSAKADANGQIAFYLKPCMEYTMKSKAKGYPDKTQQVQTGCPVNSRDELRIVMRKPKLYGNVFDKYLNKDITGATVELVDITADNKTIGLIETDEKGYFKFTLEPCHEYKINAIKAGLPEVFRQFKAPCNEKDPDAVVRLGTGIAPKNGTLVNLFIAEEQSGQPIPNAKISLFKNEDASLYDIYTDDAGYYETVLDPNSKYKVTGSKIGYFSSSKSKTDLNINKGDKRVSIDLKLLKLREGGIIALEGIFYDFAKTDIRSDAAKVLDYVVQVMEENPSMIIELGSHTDSRGGDAENLALSEQRAKAAGEYIIAKGISKDRITSRGYGETQLKNKCGNGVTCPESLHQENRRTEIRILDFKENP